MVRVGRSRCAAGKGVAVGGRKAKVWTAAGGARAAREARIGTARFLGEAPIARAWQASRLMSDFEVKMETLSAQTDAGTARSVAMSLLLGGLGYPMSWRPGHWMEVAERVLADESRWLGEADLYIVSPEMCDVVVAAAQTLTLEDLSLLSADDLPSPSGVLVLPHPLLVRAINGNLGDDRAYHWHSPVELAVPDPAVGGFERKPAVRFSVYHDTHGPVRPDSFLDVAAMARAQGTPLPPFMLDAMRCWAFGQTTTEEQRRALADFGEIARRTGRQAREEVQELGFEEERVIGEYTPGSEIDDHDDTFAMRFLYAFWRLCEQRIVVTDPAEVRHSARVAAAKAGVSPEVRVARLRTTASPGEADSGAGEPGRQWRHRWVVRMHKVRQWYPSEQRHKVIYRGPYPKGPADKPLLGGEEAMTSRWDRRVCSSPP
ncbi:hypothetical protein FHX81_0403 [Saccharothrix saharensis]|uniref:Uncharacterized protein n=1 Tax=Saccharothrix saharensis TaxID=571190 RepID=A0A543J5P9_9PSEU|nr:hypothetical protein FHX81_0403 [Saccharothrix saharensis]